MTDKHITVTLHEGIPPDETAILAWFDNELILCYSFGLTMYDIKGYSVGRVADIKGYILPDDLNYAVEQALK